MKRTLCLLMSLLALSLGTLCAQSSTKEAIKDSKAMNKYTTQQLNEKASKLARKSAKEFEKEGWEVSPGALPLEKQFDRSYRMQLEITDENEPRYIMAEAQSIAGNYDAAKMQAVELAKQNLAGQICSQITAIVENTVANSQLDSEQAATVTQTVSASKNTITQRLGRVLPVVECYRTKPNKNKEVLVRLSYDTTKAYDVAKQVVKQELEKRGVELHDQLDKALGF